MTRNRQKAKGRREGGIFIPLPLSVLGHKNFIALSPKSVKLLVDMTTQLRFSMGGTKNNGDLSIAWSIMHKRGWKSKETLRNAILELEHYGFIQLTRQGGRHKCSLYAVTWWAIDECGGKLDVRESSAPSNEWKEQKERWEPKKRKPEKSKTVPRLSVIGAPTTGSNSTK